MPPKKKKQQIINENLADMEVGEMRHIVVGPGRTGRMTIKKGPKMKNGFSLKGSTVPAKIIVGDLPKQSGTKKRKSKVIRSKGY